MSGQWEIVGKKKEKSNKSAAPKSGNETNRKKNNVHADVKIEDILAKSQVKNLYANDKNKENKQGEKKLQENGQKKTAQKKPEKSQEVPKPKPPKSIESALNLIDVGEFKSVFETNKSHFPTAPIVWLKELATFLNQKVAVDVPDPVFAFKPQNYPLSVVPSAIKIVIENATKEAGKDNAQLFFDIALTAMATDMSKNLPSLGFKLFLQHIASSEPHLVATRLTKHAELRNSYQNRANIGLSIFWAIGQAGFKDFQVGIKIFQEFMLPLIELKNYSRFVVKYLLDVINVSKNVSLTKEQYLVILETIFCNRKNFPTDLKQNLLDVVDGLKPLLFNKINKQDKLGGSVEFFLKKIANNNNKSYQHCLCDVVVEYFQRDETSMETWNKIYSKNVTSSAILLNYIDKNWKTILNKINKKSFAKIVNDISSTNTELMQKKKREEGLTDSVAVIKKLTENMAKKGQSGGYFKFFFYLFTFVSLSTLLYFDVEGSWKDSNTRHFLEVSGACKFTHLALDKGKQGLSWVDDRIEENFPGYHKTVIDFSEPYVELAKNLGVIGYNVGVNIKEVAAENYPKVVQSIEAYAPGLMEQSQSAVSNVWSTSVFYYNRSVDYLKTEVFVGQLSPQNMQRVVIEAFNTTQLKATEYYHWLYEKVQTTIK